MGNVVLIKDFSFLLSLFWINLGSILLFNSKNLDSTEIILILTAIALCSFELFSFQHISNEQNASNAQQNSELISVCKEIFAAIDHLKSSYSQIELDIESINFATKEMVKSGSEISDASSETAKIASETLMSSEKTEELIKALDENREDIKKILEFINSITYQTNLLALSVSIEAAKNEDISQSFGDIAMEVKDLSKKSKLATKEIENKVMEVEELITKTSTAISETTESLRSTDKSTNKIAMSIAKQNVFNEEIIHSIQSANKNLKELTDLTRKISHLGS